MIGKKLIARTEAYLKGLAFDCQSCGQCLLDRTGLICPMTCPKGLRNGPCGGTLNGECEVYPDIECVWVRIHRRTGGHSFLNKSTDASLANSSSWINRFFHKSKLKPLPALEIGRNRKRQPIQTKSTLEKKLKNGDFVMTCELRSPPDTDLSNLKAEAKLIGNHFDGINTTAFLQGRPTLPSPIAAQTLQSLNYNAIAQATARDHTKTTFIAELMENQINNVNTLLCVTGDSYVGNPRIKQVYDMDSSLMLYEARYLRETGRTYFNQGEIRNPPKPFLGAAINPFSTPKEVPLKRLRQKANAGADFIQTQLIFDFERFRHFMSEVVKEGINDDLFILAGVPVVISKGAANKIHKIPGVHCPDEISDLLNNSQNIREDGIRFAIELGRKLKKIDGVDGLHFMLLGIDHSVLPDIKKEILRGK